MDFGPGCFGSTPVCSIPGQPWFCVELPASTAHMKMQPLFQS